MVVIQLCLSPRYIERPAESKGTGPISSVAPVGNCEGRCVYPPPPPLSTHFLFYLVAIPPRPFARRRGGAAAAEYSVLQTEYQHADSHRGRRRESARRRAAGDCGPRIDSAWGAPGAATPPP
ncbi:hypothetical protein EVAR_103153_1 [Eumeta japonica]|uniref:Uncharacterized protein n=1 Tax=Eumeta variegata TaxID=151549 RepID=A0A4C1YHM1_EUMVA|nr:hypothetical protein EVAR_103153_1 [Eumeta japonica]